MVNDPDYDAQPAPAIEMLIPSTWDFKGAVQMYGGKTGCFSESFSVFWEATSPDGVTKFQGIPNYAWQYSDDPQELHKLTDPNRRTHTGNKTNDLCPVSKPLNAEQYFRQIVLSDLKPAMTVVSVEPFPALEQIVRQTQWTAARRRRQRRRSRRRHPGTARVSKGRQADGALVLRGARDPDLSRRQGFLYDLHAVGQVALGAPKGELDAKDKLFKVVMASIQPAASIYSLYEQVDRQLLPDTGQ